MTDQDKIITSIRYERDHQDMKWGNIEERLHTMTNDRWIRVLAEEVGESAAEVQDIGADDSKLIAELTQVAAVAVAHIEWLLYKRNHQCAPGCIHDHRP